MAKRKTVSMATRSPREGDIAWNVVIERGKAIVEQEPTSMTLRQLYYRLVSEGLIPNKVNTYKVLSRKTALARREGWFPTLIDRTREIERYAFWDTAKMAAEEMESGFRVDRTEGQPWSVYIGVEKHGMTIQLMHWFGAMGIPILALGGYSSQTFVDEVRQHVERQGRPSVLLYAGDFDASGVDIDRDFEERTEIFDKVIRVALLRKHLKQFSLPPMPGKHTDSRTASFILQHGESIQVELDALKPSDLRKLYQKQIDKFWDNKLYEKAKAREAKQRERLTILKEIVDMEPADAATRFISDLDNEDDIHQVMDAAVGQLWA